MLDSTIITNSLPVMAAEFGVTPVTISVGITAYVLMLATVIPAAGWIAERFGARQVLTLSIAGFTAASLACAIAGRFDLFIASRLAQGAAAALMAPVGRILVPRTRQGPIWCAPSRQSPGPPCWRPSSVRSLAAGSRKPSAGSGTS